MSRWNYRINNGMVLYDSKHDRVREVSREFEISRNIKSSLCIRDKAREVSVHLYNVSTVVRA